MLKTQTIAQHPDFPWLSAEDTEGTSAVLRRIDCLADDEPVTACAIAGAGNMNLTLRVTTSRRSLIVKQARPWVEKYDHIAAPWDRMLFEQAFYRRIAGTPSITARMPKVVRSDPASKIVVLEDLGKATDFTDLYAGRAIADEELEALAIFLRTLHDTTEGSFEPGFTNRAMRQLNHEHIYRFPLVPGNGLALDRFEPGLVAAAEKLKSDRAYVEKVTETGVRYLADGPCLLHGDYFPGSWLRTSQGPKVIDPEFCYFGDREFDVGCAVAHFFLAQDRAAAFGFLARYGETRLKMPWVARYASTEVMRRLIGVAQLPLPPSQGARAALLERSRRAMMTESLESL